MESSTSVRSSALMRGNLLRMSWVIGTVATGRIVSDLSEPTGVAGGDGIVSMDVDCGVVGQRVLG